MADMDTAYLLWYVREWEEEEDTELLIGVYRSEADATGAIERLKSAPGFSDYPDGFEVHPRDWKRTKPLARRMESCGGASGVGATRVMVTGGSSRDPTSSAHASRTSAP